MDHKIKLIRKIAWQIIIFLPNILSDFIFLIIIFPFMIIYGNFRYFYKRIFKIPYKVLFSPLTIPMSFLSAQAVRTQGVSADVITFDIEPIFEGLKFGVSVKKNPLVFYLTLLLDYIPFFVWALSKYDIFEFPFSGGLLYASRLRKMEFAMLRLCAKKIVIYCYGSDVYLPSEIRRLGKYNGVMDAPLEVFQNPENVIRGNIFRAQKYAHVLITGADMVKMGKKAICLPIAFDASKWPQKPILKKKILTIVHSTNHRYYKGTRFLLKTFNELKNESYPVELLLIEGKTIQECYKLYPKADIFVTDLIIGWYGSTQIEAMSIGRPVISYQREIFLPYHKYYFHDCPLVNASPQNLKRTLKKLISDYPLRKKLGEEGAEFVRKYHSFEFVGKLRKIIYQNIWQNKPINQKKFEKILQEQKII